MSGDLNAAPAQLVALLRKVHALGSLDDSILHQIAQTVQLRDVSRGEVLITEGDRADELFIVLKGRFVVLLGEKPIAEIAMGEPIGELAFFAGGPRTATVVAARNSAVMCLTRDAYEALVNATPELPSGILKAVSERLARSLPDQPALRPRAGKVCSIFPGGQAPMDPRFADGIRGAFANVAGWVVIAETDCPAAQDDPDAVAGWLEAQEAQHGNLVLLCHDPVASPIWCKVAANTSDTVLIAMEMSNATKGDVGLSAFERDLMGSTLPNSLQLALYRPDATASTRGASSWLDGRDAGLHHHVALGSETDFARLGRFLRGEALGLVLCGGGSFGTAHLGAIHAMEERGVRFDFIGGTSVGAAMGAALAIGLEPREVMALCEDIFIKSKAMSRPTIPRHSLLDHHTLDGALRHHYRDFAIEDVPLNFFANATSLTHNDVSLFRRGPVWEAVRASIALPGIFPPFIAQDGEVFVDGGLLDNAPLGGMRSLKAGSNLVLNFLPPKPWRVQAKYANLPTRGQTLTSLVKRKPRREDRHPSMMSTVTRAMVVNARKLMREIDMGDDVLMNISTLRGMSYLDWKRGRELFDHAYGQMSSAMDSAGDGEATDPLARLRMAADTINSPG